MAKIIIEARVNEFALRDENPNVPYLPEEIIADAQACYDAGASIIHYHGRTATGEPDHDPETYKKTNAGIRARGVSGPDPSHTRLCRAWRRCPRAF